MYAYLLSSLHKVQHLEVKPCRHAHSMHTEKYHDQYEKSIYSHFQYMLAAATHFLASGFKHKLGLNANLVNIGHQQVQLGSILTETECVSNN